MIPKRWTFLVIPTVFCFAEALDIASYVVLTVTNLSKTESGSRHCVFYAIKHALHDTLEKVLQAPQLDSVTKSVITNENMSLRNFDLLSNPMLIIIQGSYMSMETPGFLMKFKPSSRVLILNSQAVDARSKWERLLTVMSYYNVAYLDEVNQLGVPDNFFKTTLKRDMHERSVTFSSRECLPEQHISRIWVKASATFLNTTAREVRHRCSAHLENRCYSEHLKRRNVDLDLTVHTSLKRINNNFGILFTNTPQERVLLVPRSPLNVVELLTVPFKWHVWITLAALLTTVEVIHLLLPKTFRNEPILTVVCGFERYDLHKADRLERFTLSSLIILLFFTSRAYETRLLSMMVSRPATWDINTIQEFLQSGIRIRSNLLAGNFFLDDRSFNRLIVNGSDSILDMDLVHAYPAERRVATLVLPMYYDPGQRLHRYRVMDESLGIAHMVFILRVRSPFVDVLGHTMTALVEAGIYEKCEVDWAMVVMQQWFFVKKRFREEDDSLYFTDLSPAWMALLVGYGAGLGAFLGETY